MTAQLAPTPVFQAFGSNGAPLAFGQLFTYIAGTTTFQATWTDSTQAQQNTNPVVLNAFGQAFVWTDPNKTYKFLLQDALGNQLYVVDNIPGSGFIVSLTTGYGVDSGSANAYIYTHVVPSSAATLAAGTLIRFIPLNTNTGASTLNADGTGAVAVIRANGAALTGGEFSSLGPVVLQSTGTKWQIITTAGAQPGYERQPYEIAAGVIPVTYTYLGGHAWRYGMVADGSLGASTGTDNTAAFNTLVTVCRSSGTPLVSGFVPDGTYRFASKPNTILSACAIRGESSGGVLFLRDYTESTATNGFIESNSGALVFEDIYLIANNGSTGGTALHLIGQVGGASPDFSKIRIPYISGVGGVTPTWAYGILADGSARVGPPAGIRDLFIDDTNIFSCTTSCCTLKTVNNGQIRIAVFPAGGTASDITVTGISGNPSNNLQITANFDTTINMDWSNNCQFFVAGNATITNTSAVSNAYVLTSSLNSTQTNWLNSMIETPTTGVTGYVSAGIQFTYGKQNSLIGTVQTISVAAGQTINTNAGVVMNINNTAGANLTTAILQAGTLPYQQIEVMNANSFTITFDVAATSNVADGASDVIPALTSRKFTWNAGLLRWFRAA